MAQYGKIGSNLNQIARYLNEGSPPYQGLAAELRGTAAALAAFAENAARAAQADKGRQEYPDSITARLQRHKTAINTPKPDTIQDMVDIQKKLSEGKGKGYEKWAKLFNLKEAAKTLNFLTDNGLTDYDELAARAEEAGQKFDAAFRKAKNKKEYRAVRRVLRVWVPQQELYFYRNWK